MKHIKHLLLCFLTIASVSYTFSQEEPTPETYKGIAIDIFPLMNQIFSDDGSSSLFQITHLWGEDQRRFELGLAPQFSKIESDDDGVSDFNSYGAALTFFHGKQFSIGKNWLGAWGMSYRYRLNHQTSTSERFNGNFKIKTTSHELGLGPKLMFGFQISETVQIRSNISAMLNWNETNTKIKDGSFEAGNQKVTNYDFGFNAPQVIDLILFF